MSRRELSKSEFSLLRQIFQMREPTLLNALAKTLDSYYDSDDLFITKDYIYAVGNIPVTLLAHLDTVHAAPPTTFYHDREKGVIWTPEGLGADDRAGVFAILMILKAGYRPSIIFLTQEEVGGKGAEIFAKDWPMPATEQNFMIELDRQGCNDAVYYECGNEEFDRYIAEFGFVTDWGTFSDIAVIAPVWDTAAVNLSIGYFDEHTKCERLNYRYMFATIEKVKQILNNCGDVHYDFQMIDFTSKYNWGKGGYYDYAYPREIDGHVMCDSCDTWYPSSSVTAVVEEETGDKWKLCPSCFASHADFCNKCGKGFLNPYHTRKDSLCEACYQEELKRERSQTDKK